MARSTLWLAAAVAVVVAACAAAARASTALPLASALTDTLTEGTINSVVYTVTPAAFPATVVLTLEACSSPWVPLTLTVGSGTPATTSAALGYAQVTTQASAALTVTVAFATPVPTAGTSVLFRISANLNTSFISFVPQSLAVYSTSSDGARLNGTVNTAATANLTVYTLQTAATPVYTACALQLGASTLSPFTTTGNATNSTTVAFTIYVSGLQVNTTYQSVVISTAASGAMQIFRPVTYVTMPVAGCAFLPPTAFCSVLPYSVQVYNASTLLSRDDSANQQYQQFALALAQYNCANISYSFVRNCTDCLSAYTSWICGIEFLQCAHTVQNPSLTGVSQYTAPMCIGTCWNVFQSCPTFLGFTCPPTGTTSFAAGYQTCSAAGTVWTRARAAWAGLVSLALVVVALAL